MKTELVFQNDVFHKFWRIEVNGAAYTVTSGEVGIEGRTRTKVCESPDKAIAAAQKIAKSKLDLGYSIKADVVRSGTDPLLKNPPAKTNPETEADKSNQTNTAESDQTMEDKAKSNQAKTAEETGKSRQTKKTEETSKSKQTKKTEESRQSRQAKKAEDSRQTHAAAKNSKQFKVTNKTAKPKETGNLKQTNVSNEPAKALETRVSIEEEKETSESREIAIKTSDPQQANASSRPKKSKSRSRSRSRSRSKSRSKTRFNRDNVTHEPNIQQQLQDLVNAPNLPKALCNHFSYLVDTPGYDKVLSAIMATAVSAKIQEKNLIIEFPDEEKLIARPPTGVRSYDKWPSDFRVAMAHHDALTYPEDDTWALILGDKGIFDRESVIESNEALQDVKDPENLLSPITDFSDWWLYHPTKIQSNGEPALCRLTHEDGKIKPCVHQGIGALFLKRMAESMEINLEGFTQVDATAKDILKGLQSPRSREVIDAIRKMIAWSNQQIASGGMHPLCKLFEVDGLNSCATPILSAAIQNSAVTSSLLVEVVDVTFGSDTGSFKVTSEAMQILIKRGDLDAQIKMCKALSKLLDGPKKYWFIPELKYKFYLLVQLHPDALAEFLPHLCSALTGHIDRSSTIDNLNRMFAVALAGANPHSREKIVPSLISHVEYCIHVDRDCANLLRDVKAIDKNIFQALKCINSFRSYYLRWEFKFALSSKNRKSERLISFLDELAKNPVRLDICEMHIRISRIYEGLYNRAEWDILAKISDKLLDLDGYIDWSSEDRQYPLTYLVGAAMKMEDGGKYFDNHIRPWLGEGIHERRFAYNLAYFWAKNNEHDNMICAIKKSVQLGTSAKQFLEDSDFSAFLKPDDPKISGALGLNNMVVA